MLTKLGVLTPGIQGCRELTVTEDVTAGAVGSGYLPVFATPAMIALMEGTAADSVQPYVEAGWSTVGSHIDVRHLSPTPLGMTVRCETELIGVEGKKLTFLCRAFDDAGLIGEGTQERFLVKSEPFLIKAQQKAGKE